MIKRIWHNSQIIFCTVFHFSLFPTLNRKQKIIKEQTRPSNKTCIHIGWIKRGWGDKALFEGITLGFRRTSQRSRQTPRPFLYFEVPSILWRHAKNIYIYIAYLFKCFHIILKYNYAIHQIALECTTLTISSEFQEWDMTWKFLNGQCTSVQPEHEILPVSSLGDISTI